jgi:hypothetical protein
MTLAEVGRVAVDSTDPRGLEFAAYAAAEDKNARLKQAKSDATALGRARADLGISSSQEAGVG